MPNATLPKFRDVGDTNSPPTMSCTRSPRQQQRSRGRGHLGPKRTGEAPKTGH